VIPADAPATVGAVVGELVGLGWGRERLSASLSMLYRELPRAERPRAAAADGFELVESWWPFAPDEVPDAAAREGFARELEHSGLSLASLNFSSGSRQTGERGVPAVADGRERLRRHVPVALDLAERLGCTLMNLQYGRRDASIPLEEQLERADAAVAFIAESAAARGVRVMVEPLCEVDSPGYLVQGIEAALALCARVEARSGVSIGVCFDLFQLHPHEPRLPDAVRRAGSRIAHVQLADWPDRRAPGTGEIDIPAVLAALRDIGYDGLLGLEYDTAGDTSAAQPPRIPTGADPT
jgi:hydroxypyruvate isomerase